MNIWIKIENFLHVNIVAEKDDICNTCLNINNYQYFVDEANNGRCEQSCNKDYGFIKYDKKYVPHLAKERQIENPFLLIQMIIMLQMKMKLMEIKLIMLVIE